MKPGKTAMTALLASMVLASMALAAPTAVAARAGAERPAFTNPGAASPSLSLSVSPSGEPEVASVGPGGSLWFRSMTGGVWHKTRLGGPGSAFSGPSLYAGPLGFTGIAVQGPAHTLQFYALAEGHWHHFVVTPPDTAYSAPSLAVGTTKAGIAVEGPDHTLLCFSGSLSGLSGHLHHSTVNGPGTTFSAPSMVIRTSAQATGADPAGEFDIAVQNANHALSYYRSRPHGWQNTVIGGPSKAYSAPSLVVTTGAGDAIVSVEGGHHTLWIYSNSAGWHSQERESNNWTFSAPWLVEGDPAGTELPMAFEGSSDSLFITFYNVGASGWQNDPLGASIAYSAPVIAMTPAGGFDMVVQGKDNSLRYYQAPMPGSGLAPSFSEKTIGGHGTTFGG